MLAQLRCSLRTSLVSVGPRAAGQRWPPRFPAILPRHGHSDRQLSPPSWRAHHLLWAPHGGKAGDGTGWGGACGWQGLQVSAVHQLCGSAVGTTAPIGASRAGQSVPRQGTGLPVRARQVQMQRAVKMWGEHARGMAKRRGSKSRAPVAARHATPPVSDSNDFSLSPGVAAVVFECPSPMLFTALSSVAFVQIAGWLWMLGSNVMGFSTSSFIVSNWWCSFGLALSCAMATMTYWHSAHHLVRLAVKPGVVDELIITTHTMIGGQRTRTATRFDVVASKQGVPDLGLARHRHLMIRGHGNLILDSSGSVLDAVTLNRIMRGQPVLPALLKQK